ncbi:MULTISPECIES: class I SAM-dependent methyltransferase [Sporosarcina]|uniref:class I SAM-dependent methyltransferase n=1 Tax=Sporosarcina TaxID=1569 RepID=UPI00058BABBF|nr:MULTISPECIES: class I SAM-dependent methyltransferase [Sporosarcina]WJY26929.1 class I SAM-dependent methyltransferase [Sporosarcina sp. 0.2-SM1T-5]
MTEAERDRELRIQTEGTIEILQNSAHYNRYEATPYDVLDELFLAYPLEPGDHLVDFGCGKGRVPFYCCDRFGCSITGIDLNGRLLQEAYANLASFRRGGSKKRRGVITFEEVKAENYPIQPEQTVFYCFNPFSTEIFKSVVHGILESLEEAPRQADILLYYPTADYLEFLDEQTPFVRKEEIAIPVLVENDPDERVVIYRHE